MKEGEMDDIDRWGEFKDYGVMREILRFSTNTPGANITKSTGWYGKVEGNVIVHWFIIKAVVSDNIMSITKAVVSDNI